MRSAVEIHPPFYQSGKVVHLVCCHNKQGKAGDGCASASAYARGLTIGATTGCRETSVRELRGEGNVTRALAGE